MSVTRFNTVVSHVPGLSAEDRQKHRYYYLFSSEHRQNMLFVSQLGSGIANAAQLVHDLDRNVNLVRRVAKYRLLRKPANVGQPLQNCSSSRRLTVKATSGGFMPSSPSATSMNTSRKHTQPQGDKSSRPYHTGSITTEGPSTMYSRVGRTVARLPLPSWHG
jgi:hypothetical protein